VTTNRHGVPARPWGGGRAAAVAVALAVLGPACQAGSPGPAATPEPPGVEQARETGEEECRRFGRLLGLEGLAGELDVGSADPQDIADAYAARAPVGQRDARREGCLAGANAALAMEEEAARLEPVADQAARRSDCTQIVHTPDEGQSHIHEGDPPPEYATTPAASGPHNPGILPPGMSVYHEPVDEPTAVHNLEHAYVLLYYRPDEPSVASEIVGILEGLAREFDKVIVAPHAGLPEEVGLALVAWRRLRRCPPSMAVTDAETVARSFVLRFAGTDVAPEPLGP
jgi:hypothetical protein